MTDRRLGCYVYCVMGAGDSPPLADLPGVDDAYGVEQIVHGGLAALVSAVRMEEFGAEALKRNLEDFSWLERTALAHNEVVARARSEEAVVPFRTCTIFSDQQRFREMLENEQLYLLEVIQNLRHRDEWSVKMLAGHEPIETAAPAAMAGVGSTRAPSPSDEPGRAFFVRKKLERSAVEAASATAVGAAQRVHADLSRHAAAARLLPPQNPRVSKRQGTMILNGAYLVDRSTAAEFTALTEVLRERESRGGFELSLTGPFAPYNFVAGRAEDGG
jgi:hypothetical protein